MRRRCGRQQDSYGGHETPMTEGNEGLAIDLLTVGSIDAQSKALDVPVLAG